MTNEVSELLRELTLSAHQPELRSIFVDNVRRSIKIYIKLAEVKERPFCISSEIAEFHVYFFGALWEWYNDLRKGQKQSIFDAMLEAHLRISKKVEWASRVEFAFLVGWSQSFDWAIGENLHRQNSHCGIVDGILDIVTSLPRSEALKSFFGLGRGDTLWEMDDHGERIRNQLSLSRSSFDSIIAPKESKIYASMLSFVEPQL